MDKTMMIPPGMHAIATAGFRAVFEKDQKTIDVPERFVAELRPMGFRLEGEPIPMPVETRHPGMIRHLKPPMTQITEALGLPFGTSFDKVLKAVEEGRAALQAQASEKVTQPATKAAKR